MSPETNEMDSSPFKSILYKNGWGLEPLRLSSRSPLAFVIVAVAWCDVNASGARSEDIAINICCCQCHNLKTIKSYACARWLRIACALAHEWLMNRLCAHARWACEYQWKLVCLRMMSTTKVTIKIDAMLLLGAVGLFIIGQHLGSKKRDWSSLFGVDSGEDL
jgi:hypothetical protein